MFVSHRLLAALGSLALPALAACSTAHEFRVAAVGDPSTRPTTENTAINGSADAPLIIAAGNSLLGSASRLTLVSGEVPGTGLMNGTVSAILLTTNQTLVQLANGSSVLLSGVGGTLGDPISIDLGKGQVISGPNPLVGTNVLTSSPTAGQLTTVTIGSKSILPTSGISP